MRENTHKNANYWLNWAASITRSLTLDSRPISDITQRALCYEPIQHIAVQEAIIQIYCERWQDADATLQRCIDTMAKMRTSL